MDSRVVQHMALLMAVNCVRKTVLDDYLNDGQITEDQLNTFIRESTDKLFTFLTYLLDKSDSDKQAFLEVMQNSYPDEWPEPNLSPVFEEAVALMKQQKQ